MIGWHGGAIRILKIGLAQNPTRFEMAARIIKTLEERIAPLDDPCTLSSALTGDHAG